MFDNLNIYRCCKYAVSVVGGIVTALLGGWDTMLKVLVTFVVLDYITGIVAAWYEKDLDSNIGFVGIARKILLFIPIGVAYSLDQIIGDSQILRSLAIWFYLANEGLSIMENLGRLGIPIPTVLVEALNQLKKKSESTEAKTLK